MTNISRGFDEPPDDDNYHFVGFPSLDEVLDHLHSGDDLGIAHDITAPLSSIGDDMRDSGLHAGYDTGNPGPPAEAGQPPAEYTFGVKQFEGGDAPSPADKERALHTFSNGLNSLLNNPLHEPFVDNLPIIGIEHDEEEPEIDTVLQLRYTSGEGTVDVTVSDQRGIAVDFITSEGRTSHNRYFPAYDEAGGYIGIFKDTTDRQALLMDVPPPGDAPQLERLAAISRTETRNDLFNTHMGLNISPVTNAEMEHALHFALEARTPDMACTSLIDIAFRRGHNTQRIRNEDCQYAGALFDDVISDFNDHLEMTGEPAQEDPLIHRRVYTGDNNTIVQVAAGHTLLPQGTIDLVLPTLRADMLTTLSPEAMEAELAKREVNLWEAAEGEWEAHVTYMLVEGRLMGKLIERFYTDEAILYDSDTSFPADGDDVIIARGILYNPAFSPDITLHREG